ncbi:MAG: ArsR family transcriptional regulator [Saprospiraceae bacterium]
MLITFTRALQLEQSITSHHLKILKDANVVNASKDGKLMFYSVNHDVIAKTVGAVNKFLGK